MARIEEIMATQAAPLGGDWGGVHSLLKLIQEDRVRIGLANNALLLEITRESGDVGVYQLAEASQAEKFLPSPP